MLPFLRRIGSVGLEDPLDRVGRYAVSEVRERALNPVVSRGRVFSSEPYGECGDLGHHLSTAGSTPWVRPLLSNQPTVPAQDGFRRHQCRKLLEHLPCKGLAANGEAAPFVIVQPQPALAELPPKDPVLLEEEVQDSLLVPIQPAGDDRGKGMDERTYRLWQG